MNKRSATKASFVDKAEGAAARGRSIQAVIDRRDASKGKKSKSKAAMQAGQRRYPAKFPAQHLKKPGVEAHLDLPPMFEAPERITEVISSFIDECSRTGSRPEQSTG